MASTRSEPVATPPKRTLSYFRPEWPTIAGSAVLTVAATAAEAASLILIILLAGALSSNQSETLEPSLGPFTFELSFYQVALLAGGLLAIAAVGQIAAHYVISRRRTELARQWRNEMISGFLGSTFEYESSLKRGQVLAAAGDHSVQASLVLDHLANGLNSTFSVLILAGAAFVLDPLVATVLLLGGGLMLIALRPLSRRSRQLSGTIARLDVDLGNRLDETVREARDIKLFGASDEFTKSAYRTTSRMAQADRRRAIYTRTVPILYQSVGLLLLLVSLIVASSFTGASLAAMGGAALLLLRGLTYGQQLSRLQQNLSRALPYVERVKQQQALYASHVERFGTLEIDQVESMELDNVTYGYKEGGPPAVLNARLTIKEPGIYGLVGRSGSGKSTVAQLLLRLRTPTSGRVLVNGVDSREYEPETWQQAVSFVPQEAELIHGSVAENIGFFRDWVTRDQIEKAAEAVGMAEAITSLPDGFDTQIGPTERDFSGGQKQRIGIARALVGQPSLFVLDEPTSALDEESELWVMRTLRMLRKTCIVIVITHRASTMGHSDVIVHLDEGQVMSTERQVNARWDSEE